MKIIKCIAFCSISIESNINRRKKRVIGNCADMNEALDFSMHSVELFVRVSLFIRFFIDVLKTRFSYIADFE